jgi:glycosyltransferase involved in cell wall biosynthesis
MIWDMAAALTAIGHKVEVVAPYPACLAPLQGITVHRFRWPRWGARNPFLLWWIALVAAWTVRRNAVADIVHVTDAFSAAAAGLLARQPVVFTVSGNIYQREQSSVRLDAIATFAYKIASRVAAKRTRVTIATSRDMAFWWRFTGTPSKRIVRIPLGVDTQQFKREHPSRLPSAAETPTQLIAVGRLVPENDLHIALEAVAEVRAGLRDELVLNIVGDGPLLPALRQQARRLKIASALIWHGEVTYGDLVRLYSASDLMLIPRQNGAPPRVVAEAMACGLPVVGFRAAGVDDYVEHGESGLLAPPGDLPAFVENLRHLLLDSRMRIRMESRARRHAEARLSWDVIASRLSTEVYAPLGRLHGLD